MVSIKNSEHINDVLKQFSYHFGEVYVFHGFIVAEINEGETIGWENGTELMVRDVSKFLNTNGDDLIYISNRIHSYSIVATDWLKFFKHSYSIKSYYIVSNNNVGTLNSAIEKLFFSKKIIHFKNLNDAISEAKKFVNETAGS